MKYGINQWTSGLGYSGSDMDSLMVVGCLERGDIMADKDYTLEELLKGKETLERNIKEVLEGKGKARDIPFSEVLNYWG